MITDYELAKEKMVEVLVRRGIGDQKVLTAMSNVPRHLFVSDDMQELAYADRPLPIGMQQTISQPYIVALMTEMLELNESMKVLEIGTGSGYQTAVLAELCNSVYTVELFPELLESATALLRKLGYRGISAKIADGTGGWSEYMPYDAIIVCAGAPNIPKPLFEQLAEGGRLIIPVGDNVSQLLKIVSRRGDEFSEKQLLRCQFVPLRGEHGW
ncbi:MAG: protein-L-isoaspartate O-methyltransferase [Desulfobulbaceae bacterium BRH_c16a]|nr:MAG: protein-L-isoaspartate O-methyltransferase [Desulfobulbaceae bacterium BRH_c16a]